MLTENERIFLEQLFQKYAPSLFRYSLSFLRSLPDAPSLSEECVQETFVVALRKFKNLQKCQSPEGYLMAICRRITMSRRRKEWNRQRITGVPVPIDGGLQVADVRNRVDEWIDKHDLQQKKRQLLETLTEQELAVFRAYFEEELSMEACAAKLHLTKTAVMGTVQRIRSKAAKVSLMSVS